mgnify:CR=1 FL=1
MAISVGIVKVSSIFCSARMGIPAATRPTSGSETVPRGAVGSSDLEIETEEPSSLKSSRARGLVASRLSSPRASRAETGLRLAIPRAGGGKTHGRSHLAHAGRITLLLLIFLDEVVNLLLTLGNFASHQGILSTHVKQMFEFCLTGTTVRR